MANTRDLPVAALVFVLICGTTFAGESGGFADDSSPLFFRAHGDVGIMVSPGGSETAGPQVLYAPSSAPDEDRLISVDGERMGGGFLIDTDLSLVPAEYNQEETEMAFGLSNYLVVWQDERAGDFDIFGARVSPSGAVIDTIGIQISAQPGIDEKEPYVAFDGANFLVIWQDERNPGAGTDIYGARVSPDGVVLDPGGFMVSGADEVQYYPSVAFNGTNFLATWSDFRNGTDHDIFGARITTDGTVLDSSGILLYAAPDNQAYSSVASDGSDWFVSWAATFDTVINAVRVASDGTVLDPGGFTISTGPNFRFWPDASFDGTNYFLVWQDQRSGADREHYGVYGARVTPAGVVLDPTGIPIADDPTYYEGIPEVLFGGTDYMVVWGEEPTLPPHVTGARVAPNGTVLDPGGIVLNASERGYESDYTIGYDGANWLVAWEDHRGNIAVYPPGNGDDVRGTRVDSTGAVLDPYPNEISISTSATWQYKPKAAQDGSNHLVVWQERTEADQWDLKGARIDPNGAILDSPALEICAEAQDQHNPDVAFGAGTYLTVWHDQRTDTSSDIYAARIGVDGTIHDPCGFMIADSTWQMMPSVSFDGTNFMVAWWDYSPSYGVRGARIASDGTVLDSGGFNIATVSWDYGWSSIIDISIGFDGTNHVVVWSEFISGSWDIHAARISPDGTVLDPEGFPVSFSSGAESNPGIACGSGQCLVVWEDDRNADVDIYAARIDTTGTVLDPAGIPLTSGGGDEARPQAGFNGTDFVVVWGDSRNGNSEIFTTRVDADGNASDPCGVMIAAGDRNLEYPSVGGGPAGRNLIVYNGFVEDTYRSTRAWGLFVGEDASLIFADGFESGDTSTWN